MEEFDSATPEKISKYHSAFDQLRRIGYLFQVMSKEVREGNYLQWNINLDRLWMELIGDLEDNSKEETEINNLNAELLKLHPLVQTTGKTFNKMEDKQVEKISKQYLLLCKKEALLRRLLNKQGKGTAWRDESEDDFD